MGKYTSKTKRGMARRRNNADAGYGKHRPGLQFNPHNGEPHSPEFIAKRRAEKARKRAARKEARA